MTIPSPWAGERFYLQNLFKKLRNTNFCTIFLFIELIRYLAYATKSGNSVVNPLDYYRVPGFFGTDNTAFRNISLRVLNITFLLSVL